MFQRNQLAIVVAEFLGTGALTLAVLSVQHSTIGLPYFVALMAGLMIVALTLVFGRSNGGPHLNPAITIGMWTTRQVKTLPAIVYIVAQMLGAWATYYLFTYFSKMSLQPIGGHYDSRVLVAEAVGGFVFALGWAAAVFNGFRHAKSAATVGIAFVLAVVVASSASLGIINPAVALGARAFAVFGSMGWGTYALGPVLGAIIGFNLYALLFAPESSLVGMSVKAAVADRTTSVVSAAPAVEKVSETAKTAPKAVAKSANKAKRNTKRVVKK